MAAVCITIDGVLCDKYGRTIRPVRLVGEATLTGLGVGGGPIMPPGNGGDGGDGKPPGNGKPPGIWGGPIDPYPGHPLPEPPGKPDVPPPSIWPDPPEGVAPHPEHPIVLPPPGEEIPPGTLITWKPVWTPDEGWMVIGFPNIPHPAPGAG